MTYEQDRAAKEQDATEAMIRMRDPRGWGPHPSQIADLENCFLMMHEALHQIQRYARSDGQQTFDDCIRDLGRIDDICRGALK